MKLAAPTLADNRAPRRQRRNVLPPSLAPRGLSRVETAQYVGVSPTKFDEMVADRRMPKPKRIDGRVVWDRLAIDRAFEGLPDDNVGDDPWGSVST
jgi:predicted DNA-binding transcriptional regulator AlpA